MNTFTCSQHESTTSTPNLNLSPDFDANEIIQKHSSRIETRTTKVKETKNLTDDFSKLDVKAGVKSTTKKPVKKEEDDLWEMLNN